MRNAPRTEIQEIYQKLGNLVADGTLSAKVEQVYPLDQFKTAFEHSLKSNRSGKTLFKFGRPCIDARYWIANGVALIRRRTFESRARQP
jgi:hypothetical protein